MHAAYLNGPGGPEALVYGELPDPTPAQGEVLVRMRATTVNHVDAVIRSGIRPYFTITPPHILGHELSGEIVALGDGVTNRSVGQRVIAGANGYGGKGSYAELVRVKADDVFPLPDAVSFEDASGLAATAVTAYQMVVRRAEMQPGGVVVITAAASGTGSTMVQIARAAGCVVIGTAGGAAKREMVASIGAHHTIDHYDEDVTEKILEFTGGVGADAAIDAVSSQPLYTALINGLRPGGRLVTYGNIAGGELSFSARTLFSRGIELRGGQGGDPRLLAGPRIVDTLAVLQLAAAGAVKMVPGKVLPLAAAAQGHEAMEAHSVAGKIILIAD